VRHILEQERRKNERVQEGSNTNTSSNNSSIFNNTNESVVKATIVNKESTMRHIGSASEPESDEVWFQWALYIIFKFVCE